MRSIPNSTDTRERLEKVPAVSSARSAQKCNSPAQRCAERLTSSETAPSLIREPTPGIEPGTYSFIGTAVYELSAD